MSRNETAPALARRGGKKQNPVTREDSANSEDLPFVVRWRNAICSAASTLTSTQRHVALTLSLYANSDGADAFPSEETLSKACALSVRAVRNALRTIVQSGWATRSQRRGEGKAWAWNIYRLTIPQGVREARLPQREGPAPRAGAETGGPAPDAGARVEGPERRAGTKDLGPAPDDTKDRHVVPEGPAPRAYDLALKHLDLKHVEAALTRDDKVVIWTQGLSLLTKSGTQELKARRILGKLRGMFHDDAALADLIEQAERDQVIDPASWLMGAAKRRASKPTPTLGRISEDEADRLLDAAITRLEAA